MHALLPLLEQAVINGIVHKKAPLMRKNKFGMGLALLSGLLLISACGLGIYAAFVWLSVSYAAHIAALYTALGVLACSIVSMFAGLALLKKKPKPEFGHQEISQIISDISDVVGPEMTQPIQDNPKTAVMLASLAGFVAGDRLN